uniref:Venom bombolitin 1 n=2 Tax=Bombus TaxID=144708 RepID=F1CGQ4_BOMTE|nr:bombolitin [Bombus ignitus]ACY09650.1 bombolitin [Bombus ignitus]ADY75781.1 venom bombolitin 1 [Bombus terrestris]AEN41592.1 venom bombolitin 1 [Bombus terrestris]
MAAMRFLLCVAVIFMIAFISVTNANPEPNPSPEADPEALNLKKILGKIGVMLSHLN